jgi:hypothetical protein
MFTWTCWPTKRFPDPFFGANESKLQWIENESWEYRLNLRSRRICWRGQNVDLVFDGLDAAAQVYVNGASAGCGQYVPHLARAGEEPLARGHESAARGLSVAHQGCCCRGGKRCVPAAVEDRGQDLYSQGGL